MTDAPHDLPLASWTHTPESIPQGGLKTARVASADDLNAMAAALDLPSIDVLSFDYTIKNAGGGTYRLTGRLTAKVVQSCVVTLEPVPGGIGEDIQVEFRPDERPHRTTKARGADAEAEEEPLDVDFESDVDLEPITDGKMDIGRIVFETLASALDPYPRKDDAAFDWKSTDDGKTAAPNPFAALAKLKNKS